MLVDIYVGDGNGGVQPIASYKDAPLNPFLLACCERETRARASGLPSGCRRGQALDDCLDAIEARKPYEVFVSLVNAFVGEALVDRAQYPVESRSIAEEGDALLYLARALYA